MVNFTKQIKNKLHVDSRQYNWSRVNTDGVSGDLSTSGSGKVLTFTVRPVGLLVGNYVYVSGGTGTAEAVVITALTGTAGAAGTMTVTTANTHTGGWTVGSATAGIQEAALSGSTPRIVYVPNGTYIIYAPITFPSTSTSQYGIVGESRLNTILSVHSSFPLSATGVIVSSPGLGPHLSRFVLGMAQPDSTNLATYTEWPPAIYLRGVTNADVEELLIYGAWWGFECSGGVSPTLNGNCSRFSDIWLSAYNRGIVIDGSLDSIRIFGLHYWPFGGTANNVTAFNDASNIGIEVGRADDVKVNNCLFFSGVGIKMTDLGNGVSTGEITNTDFDSQSGIVMTAGTWSASGILWSTAAGTDTNKQFINITGGILTLSNSTGIAGAGNTLPIIQADFDNGAETNALILTGNSINTAFVDVPAISAEAAGGTVGSLVVTGNWFYRLPNTAYTQPTISVTSTGLRAVVTGNATYTKGTGAGTFISAASDVEHVLGPNSAPGWTNSYPAGTAGAYYADSTQFTVGAAITSNFLGPFAINGTRVRNGTGDPNGAVVGSVGDMFLRTDGGASSTLYIKESGAATNTGWVGK
jgi:hypothetical protein